MSRRPRGHGRAAARAPGGKPLALLAGALVFASAIAVYGRSTGYSFLNWDDNVYVLENPWIRAFTWSTKRQITSSSSLPVPLNVMGSP